MLLLTHTNTQRHTHTHKHRPTVVTEHVLVSLRGTEGTLGQCLACSWHPFVQTAFQLDKISLNTENTRRPSLSTSFILPTPYHTCGNNRKCCVQGKLMCYCCYFHMKMQTVTLGE